MRKGVSDLWRKYQVGIAANHPQPRRPGRQLIESEGVAAVDALCRPRTSCGRRYARFNPLSPTDLALSEPLSPASTPSKDSPTPTSPDVSTGT
jgi:hypothetical protein